MAFVRSSIPVRMLSDYRLPPDIQAVLLEINLRKEKWLFVSAYKPPSLTVNIFVIPYLNFWVFMQAFMTISFFWWFQFRNITSSYVSFMNNENFINIVNGNTFPLKQV